MKVPFSNTADFDELFESDEILSVCPAVPFKCNILLLLLLIIPGLSEPPAAPGFHLGSGTRNPG